MEPGLGSTRFKVRDQVQTAPGLKYATGSKQHQPSTLWVSQDGGFKKLEEAHLHLGATSREADQGTSAIQTYHRQLRVDPGVQFRIKLLQTLH